MKQLFFITIALINTCVLSQNKQILYGLAETPQALMLNPGAEISFNSHIGIPVFSGFSVNLGVTGTKMSDLFLTDGVDFNIKLGNVINQLTENDFLSLNVQIEIVNGGYRLKNNTYITFGIYEEFDFIGYFPKDIVTLLYEGNASYLGRSFNLLQMEGRGELFSVIHVGFSRKINNNFHFGGRIKLYSGNVHVESIGNKADFRIEAAGNNIYRYYLSNVDATIRTSGFFENDIINIGSNGFFLGGNLGAGIDVGFTYHYTPQIEFTGSALDVGFIHSSKNIKNVEIAGNYVFDGIEFLYDSNNPRDYWAQLDSDFLEKVPREKNSNPYTSWRPVKLNAGVKYSFGYITSNEECYNVKKYKKSHFSNSVGLQLYSISRPLRNQLAATVFYEKNIGEKVHTKLTYTVDNYSFSNIGIGISTQLGVFNVYGTIDSIIGLTDITAIKSTAFQVGFNLIFD